MKNVMWLVLAVAVTVSLGAQAAPKKPVYGKKAAIKKSTNPRALKRVTTTAIKTSAAKAQKPGAKAPTSPAYVTPTTPMYSPASSTGSGKSVVAAPAAASTVPTKRASIKLIDRAFVPMNFANGQYDGRIPYDDQDIQAKGTMNLRLGYKLTDKASVGLGTDADHSYGALNDGKALWVPYDVFASIAHSNLTTLPGEIGVKGSFRFYAPTSESSQSAGQIARLRANLTLSRQFGPVNLFYSADPQYYFQEYLTSTAINKDTKQEEHSGTRNFRLYHFGGVEVEITPSFGAYSNLGLDQGWYNDDPNFKLKKNTKPTSKIYAETGVTYTFTQNISMAAGVVQDSNPDMLAQQPEKEGPLYRDEFSAYFVEATLSF